MLDSMIQSISMMSLDGKSTEPPSAALESTRGCSNHCNCTTLDYDSGAGANAGLKVDTMFVGTGPLSELVWSPQKGLSIKRAACKEKTCILWRPEANEVVVSSSTKRVTDNTCQNSTTPNISNGARQEMPINFLNSARSYSAGKKQLHYDSSLIGSKRLKRHIQDSPGCSLLVRHDRSFMNWISNMMKGLMSSRESPVPSVELTLVDPEQARKVPEQRLIGLGKKTGSAGFQTFFDSLYRPKRKAQEILPLNHADQSEEYGAVERDDRVHNFHPSLRAWHAETGIFHKLFKLPDSKKNNFELPSEEKANQACGPEGGPTTSLWIARFAPTVPVPLSGRDACNQTPGEAPSCCTNGMTLKYPTDQFSVMNSNQRLQHCKYLDPVIPCAQTCGTYNRNSPDLSKEKICQLDHKVMCPQIKRSEVMVSILARRLDALKHIVPSDASQDALPIHRADLGASSVSRSKLKFKAGNDFGRRLSHSGDYHFQAASALSTFDGNDTWKGKDLNTRQDEAVSSPKPVIDAVKRLQLSRSDVLKWIHSPMPLPCLDGFFLRLRLRKWDAGLDQPRYHVACITGVQKERILNSPKISTSVDVGGINCQVESRYISNQDFVEDELMAWWTSVSKGGGKVPSEEDLRLKFQEKKLLGL